MWDQMQQPGISEDLSGGKGLDLAGTKYPTNVPPSTSTSETKPKAVTGSTAPITGKYPLAQPASKTAQDYMQMAQFAAPYYTPTGTKEIAKAVWKIPGVGYTSGSYGDALAAAAKHGVKGVVPWNDIAKSAAPNATKYIMPGSTGYASKI